MREARKVRANPARARLRSLRQTPLERGDSLPEQRWWRAFPRLPLVDDGFPRRAHQCGQLRLAPPARATQRANPHIVIVGHTSPTSMAHDGPPASLVAQSTTAETPWPRRESREPGGGERSSACHRSPAGDRRGPLIAAS